MKSLFTILFLLTNIFVISYSKAEGVNYLSDHICNALDNPGPFTYYPSDSVTKKNFSCSVSMRVPSKGLPKNDKIQKSHGPDVGTYENRISADYRQSIRRSTPSIKFAK